MNYLKIDKASVADGIGFRVVLYVSGCRNHCKGCHNPQSWNFVAGKLFTEEINKRIFSLLEKPYIRGLTISGGDPMETENITTVKTLIKNMKQTLPNKDVWLYTGYETFTEPQQELLDLCDVAVIGPFIESEKDLSIPFRGSRNQKILIHQKDGSWYNPTDDEVREGKIFTR